MTLKVSKWIELTDQKARAQVSTRQKKRQKLRLQEMRSLLGSIYWRHFYEGHAFTHNR